MKYVYTVWLETPDSAIDDPDREWPACFIIDGPDEVVVKNWGDHVAQKYANAHEHIFLFSGVEAVETSTFEGLDKLPAITVGQEPSDDYIGW